MKQIIVCADDFGLNPEINTGIMALAQRGVLSATSCMSHAPFFAGHAAQLKQLPIQTGLHLNFTEKLGDDDTCVFPLAQLVLRSYTGLLKCDKIKAAIERQLDRFEEILGRVPDYVDGHQHVHQFPIIRGCLLEILAHRYPREQPWIRSTRPPASGQGSSLRLRMKAATIAALGAPSMRREAKRHGLPISPHLLGVYGFTGGANHYQDLLDVWLGQAQEGDVLMCHPALGMGNNDPLAAQRMAEFDVLSSPDFPMLLETHQVKITPRNPA